MTTGSKYNVSAHVPHTDASPLGSPSNRYLQSIADRINNAIQMLVYATGTTSLPNNVATKIAWGSVASLDSQGGYQNSTNTIVSQGTYLIDVSAQLNITTSTPTVTGGAYPSPPWAETICSTVVSTSTPIVPVYLTTGFSVGMACGIELFNGAGSKIIGTFWFTIIGITTNTNLQVSPNIPGNTNPVGADTSRIWGVAIPTAPSISATAVDYWLYIYKNGVEVGQAHTNSLTLNNPTLNIVQPLQLGVGDKIEIYAKQNSGSTQQINAGNDTTWFHCIRLL